MIPEFDMRVLSDVVDSENGWFREDLYQKYGSEISETIDLLTKQGLIEVHTHDLKPFLPPDADYKDPPKGAIVATRVGKIEVRRWRTSHVLTNRERWKERIFGAGFTFLVWVLQELIKRSI